MKKITDYSVFHHYGCSFVDGYDAGGDGIHDKSLSYPVFLQKLVGNDLVNRALSGNSNDMSFNMLCADIINNDIKDDSVVIFNLTNNHRTQYLFDADDFSLNHIQVADTRISFKPMPSAGKEKEEHLTIYKHTYLEQHEFAFYTNTIRNIAAVSGICNYYNIPYIVIDLFADIHWFTKHNQYMLMDDTIINMPEGWSIVSHMQKKLTESNKYLSAHKHYYATGYEYMANVIYNRIKDIEL